MSDEVADLNSPTGLPIDLVCDIIAFVDGDDDEYVDRYTPDYRVLTLAACSLVCKAWSNIARAHIFGSFAIRYTSFESRLSFLHFTAPHLGGYVRELIIWGDNSNNTGLTPPQWTPSAFRRFSNLHSLSFYHVTGKWSSLPVPLAVGITTLLAAPGLQKLRLQWWDFGTDVESIQNMLSLCSTSLKDLSLVYVDCHGDPHANAQAHVLSPVNMVALSKLRLVCVHHPRLSDAFIECPNLESMTAEIEKGRLFVPLGVKDLSLIINPRAEFPKFEKMIRLSTLGIRTPATPPTTLSNIQEWINGIDNLPYPDLLEQLTVELSHDRAVTEYPRLAEYKAFSASLTRLRNHSGLKRISISIMIFTHAVPSEDYSSHQAREEAKLKDGFASLLGPGVDVRLSVRGSRWSESVFVDCRV
ncbi:hypothetical protein PC9H_002242 [Pleurotus ostreatus]|uniref:F-box domain-containing protein n=1 Tax=Pleurotus ostreatus TaxID=5322 RepID=A0A8H6ZI57_PLEOS|nr:uncharacterized protein PC9H_002242 [Pleurotus ostreatus]KAF7419650.1 hypothetical protein PC9H_002242 [Pleurotus ostreatus]